jgi:hypothetical protein
MKLSATDRTILAALHQAGPDSSIPRIREYIDGFTADNLSSYLCKLRKEGFTISDMRMCYDSGRKVNFWTLSDAGKAAAIDPPTPDTAADIQADINNRPAVPESPDSQPVDSDILPDISAPYHTGKSAVATCLVDEAKRLQRARLPDIDDALYVLRALSEIACDGMPAFQGELQRIARYLIAQEG